MVLALGLGQSCNAQGWRSPGDVGGIETRRDDRRGLRTRALIGDAGRNGDGDGRCNDEPARCATGRAAIRSVFAGCCGSGLPSAPICTVSKPCAVQITIEAMPPPVPPMSPAVQSGATALDHQSGKAEPQRERPEDAAAMRRVDGAHIQGVRGTSGLITNLPAVAERGFSSGVPPIPSPVRRGSLSECAASSGRKAAAAAADRPRTSA